MYTHLDFKCEVFLEVLNDHNQKGEFYAEGFLRVGWARNVSGANIRANNLQNQALDIIVSDSLYVPIPNFFIPYLQWFAAYAVKN